MTLGASGSRQTQLILGTVVRGKEAARQPLRIPGLMGRSPGEQVSAASEKHGWQAMLASFRGTLLPETVV